MVAGSTKNKSTMSLDDIKIFALNGTAFAISVSNAETILKIVLLIVSIGYTGHKWYTNMVNKK